MGVTLEMCGGFWGQRLWGPAISVLLLPGFHTGFARRRGCFSAGVLSSVDSRHLYVDCFWVTASVILLLVIIVSLLCTTLMFFMCFA